MSRIITRISASRQDTVIDLTNQQMGRTMDVGSNWTHLRIGMRCSISGSTAFTPKWYFGVCSGTSSMVASSQSANFIGISWLNNSLLQMNPSTADWGQLGGSPFVVTRVVSGSEMSHSNTGLSGHFYAKTPFWREAFIVDIQKGSPNYLVGYYKFVGTQLAAADISLEQLTASMLSTSSIIGGLSGHGYASASLLFTEASGALDTINLWWGTSANTLEVSELLYTKLS